MTIRVFVGCAANHEDLESQSVLEHSIRKNTKRDVEITWMKLTRDPVSPFYSEPEKGLGWNHSGWATPFTGFRWAIPSICDYKGKAIYSDSDVLFKADIGEFWDQVFSPGAMIMAKGGYHSWRFCVSLWNCELAAKWIPHYTKLMKDPQSAKNMHAMIKKNSALMQPFRGNWNCLDGEKYESLDHPDIKAIHYTSMPHQPHLGHAIPRLQGHGKEHWFKGEVKDHWRKDLIELFDKELTEAANNGFPPGLYMQEPEFGPYNKRDTHKRSSGIPSWGK